MNWLDVRGVIGGQLVELQRAYGVPSAVRVKRTRSRLAFAPRTSRPGSPTAIGARCGDHRPLPPPRHRRARGARAAGMWNVTDTSTDVRTPSSRRGARGRQAAPHGGSRDVGEAGGRVEGERDVVAVVLRGQGVFTAGGLRHWAHRLSHGDPPHPRVRVARVVRVGRVGKPSQVTSGPRSTSRSVRRGLPFGHQYRHSSLARF